MECLGREPKLREIFVTRFGQNDVIRDKIQNIQNRNFAITATCSDIYFKVFWHIKSLNVDKLLTIKF